MMGHFKVAIKKMIVDGEFEKLINYAPTFREKLAVKKYKTRLERWENSFGGLEGIPVIMLIKSCKSYTVLQTAVMYMGIDLELERGKCE